MDVPDTLALTEDEAMDLAARLHLEQLESFVERAEQTAEAGRQFIERYTNVTDDPHE